MGFFNDFSEASAPPAGRSASSGPSPRPGSAAASSRGVHSGRSAPAASNRPRPSTTATTPGVRPAVSDRAASSSAVRSSDGGGGFNVDRFAPFLQQGWNLFGSQVAQRSGSPQRPAAPTPAPSPVPSDIGGPAPEPAPSATDGAAGPQPHQQQYGQPAPGIAPGVDRLALLMQALRQRQIPPMPAPAPPPMTATPQADGLRLLQLILGNPQFQRALQQAALRGTAASRTIELPVPALAPAGGMRSVRIPLGAAVNAIAGLTGPVLMQLNARTSEDDPEVPSYLVSDDGEFIVDPASPDDRASLVIHMFELSEEAQRLEALRRRRPSRRRHSRDELDESDEWAREVGF